VRTSWTAGASRGARRHCDSGPSMTTVSNISVGAGSVALEAPLAIPPRCASRSFLYCYTRAIISCFGRMLGQSMRPLCLAALAILVVVTGAPLAGQEYKASGCNRLREVEGEVRYACISRHGALLWCLANPKHPGFVHRCVEDFPTFNIPSVSEVRPPTGGSMPQNVPSDPRCQTLTLEQRRKTPGCR
jgi:hypothetical protein